MITFNFAISNPFKHREWKSLLQRDWIVSKNKTLEIGFFRDYENIVEICLDTRWRGNDHAGPSVEINLFNWKARVALPDHRHWDYENNRWVEYNTR